MIESEQRAAAIAEALMWIGTPFAMGQASKGYGVDCGLFLAACYRAAGIAMPLGFGLFPRDWHLHTKEERYLEIIERHLRRVEFPAPGDIALVRTKSCQPFSHAALVVAWPMVIHAAYFRGGGVSEFDAGRGMAARWETRFYSPWGKRGDPLSNPEGLPGDLTQLVHDGPFDC